MQHPLAAANTSNNIAPSCPFETCAGNSTADAALLGMQSGLAEKALALAADETVTKVQLRARDCLEYVRFVTSKARVLAAGNAASNATLVTAYPNRAGGFLGAVRGYEQYARALAGVTVRGPLSTFQLVWAACVANTTREYLAFLGWVGSGWFEWEGL